MRNDLSFSGRAAIVFFSLQLVQSDERVFASQHILLFAAVRPEADVIHTIFAMLRFSIDHCVLGLEATLGLLNGLAEQAFTVLGDADVQGCGAACPLDSLESNTAKQGTLAIFSTTNRSKIVTSLRHPHVWPRFETGGESGIVLAANSKITLTMQKSIYRPAIAVT